MTDARDMAARAAGFQAEADAAGYGRPGYLADPIYQAALHPRQRLDAAGLQPCHWHDIKDYPGHRALVLTAGNTETLVCLEQPDVALIRAAVTRPDEKGQLAALRNEWSARVGPGGAKAVDAGHAAGYSLGVDDMLASVRDYEESPVTESEVLDWLAGFYESAVGGDEQSAVSLVRDMITRKLEGR